MKQIVEQLLLIRIQARKRSTIWGVLAHPQRTMRHQRLAVHQKGARVRERTPQPVKHSKTMGVDIAPVIDMRSRYPRGGLQKVNAVTQAEYHDGLGEVGKRQTVDLVFGYEDIACGDIQRSKIADRNGEVG